MSEYEDTLQAIKTTYGPLLRQKDLCEAAGICQTKAMKLIRSGQIPSVFLAEGRIRRYAILAEMPQASLSAGDSQEVALMKLRLMDFGSS